MAHARAIKNTPILFIPRPLDQYELFTDVNRNYYKNIMPYYMVSNYGRVFNKYTNEFISTTVSTDPRPGCPGGRFYVSLQFYDPIHNRNIGRTIPISRLMMISFNYRSDCDYLEVDHVDGVWSHNYLSNLEWVTPAENKRRAREKDLVRMGGSFNDRNHAGNLTEVIVHKICKLLEQGFSNAAIAVIFDVSPGEIYRIRSGKSWKRVSKLYNFRREELC